MPHHRCSRCKQEAERRHKRHGCVICDTCLAHELFGGRVRHWWSGLWDRFTLWVDRALGRTPEQLKVRRKEEASRQYVMRKEMRLAAQKVPVNPLAVLPQKR